jgi:hypothetical protein
MKKIGDILERLLAETREIPANDRVPYAFEKRIMAHIKEAPAAVADVWLAWSQSLWKAVVPCLAVLVMVVVWMKAPADGSGATTPQGNAAPAVANFEAPGEEDLESIVMLAIDPDSTGE